MTQPVELVAEGVEVPGGLLDLAGGDEVLAGNAVEVAHRLADLGHPGGLLADGEWQTIGDKAVQVGPGGRLAWLSVGSNPCLAGNPTTASNSSTAITP